MLENAKMVISNIKIFSPVYVDEDGNSLWDGSSSGEKYLRRVAPNIESFLRKLIYRTLGVRVNPLTYNLISLSKNTTVELAIVAKDLHSSDLSDLFDKSVIFKTTFYSVLEEISALFKQLEDAVHGSPHRIKIEWKGLHKPESDAIYTQSRDAAKLANKIRSVTAKLPTPIEIKVLGGPWVSLDLTNVAIRPVSEVQEESDRLTGTITVFNRKCNNGEIEYMENGKNSMPISWQRNENITNLLGFAIAREENISLYGNYQQRWVAGKLVKTNFHISKIEDGSK